MSQLSVPAIVRKSPGSSSSVRRSDPEPEGCHKGNSKRSVPHRKNKQAARSVSKRFVCRFTLRLFIRINLALRAPPPILLKLSDGNPPLPLAQQQVFSIRNGLPVRACFYKTQTSSRLGHNSGKDQVGICGAEIPVLIARSCPKLRSKNP